MTFPNAAINKIPQPKGTPAQMAKLYLKRDQIDKYATKDLPMTSNALLQESVCYESHCCNFTINYSVKPNLQNTVTSWRCSGYHTLPDGFLI